MARDVSIPNYVRALGAILAGDEPEVLAAIAYAQTGRIPGEGETIDLEIDLRRVGLILKHAGNLIEALQAQASAHGEVSTISDQLIEAMQQRYVHCVIKPRVRGQRASALARRDRRSDFEDAVVADARKMLAEGHERHTIASKIAARRGTDGKSRDSVARRVRAAMKKYGI